MRGEGLAKGTIVSVTLDIREAVVVEGVEELAAELEPHSPGHVEILDRGKIPEV